MQPEQDDVANLGDLRRHTDEILAVLDDLLAAHGERQIVEVKRRNEERARTIAVLASEAFASAEATRLLVRAGLASDACTTARRTFEHAVTAAWLKSDRGSVEAFMREKGLRATANLAAAVRNANVDLPEELLAEAEKDIPSRTELDKMIRSFEKMCGIFSPRFYMVYRYFSGHAHPSGASVAAYHLDEEEGKKELVTAQMNLLAAHLAVASAVWAGRALDDLVVHKPFKQKLRAVARKLSIATVLHPDMDTDPRRWPV